MVVMIFLIGLLLGVLGGGALCVRYLRQEIAADVGPSLRRMQMQLDTLCSEINLAQATRLADLQQRQSSESHYHQVATVTDPGLPRDQTRDGNDFRLAARPSARSSMASYISLR